MSSEVVSFFRRGGGLDRQGLAETLGLWALDLRDQAVRAAQRPEAALLPAPLGGGLGLGQAVEGFIWVRQAQSQILANAAPELVVTVLLEKFGRLAARGQMA